MNHDINLLGSWSAQSSSSNSEELDLPRQNATSNRKTIPVEESQNAASVSVPGDDEFSMRKKPTSLNKLASALWHYSNQEELFPRYSSARPNRWTRMVRDITTEESPSLRQSTPTPKDASAKSYHSDGETPISKRSTSPPLKRDLVFEKASSSLDSNEEGNDLSKTDPNRSIPSVVGDGDKRGNGRRVSFVDPPKLEIEDDEGSDQGTPLGLPLYKLKRLMQSNIENRTQMIKERNKFEKEKRYHVSLREVCLSALQKSKMALQQALENIPEDSVGHGPVKEAYDQLHMQAAEFESHARMIEKVEKTMTRNAMALVKEDVVIRTVESRCLEIFDASDDPDEVEQFNDLSHGSDSSSTFSAVSASSSGALKGRAFMYDYYDALGDIKLAREHLHNLQTDFKHSVADRTLQKQKKIKFTISDEQFYKEYFNEQRTLLAQYWEARSRATVLYELCRNQNKLDIQAPEFAPNELEKLDLSIQPDKLWEIRHASGLDGEVAMKSANQQRIAEPTILPSARVLIWLRKIEKAIDPEDDDPNFLLDHYSYSDALDDPPPSTNSAVMEVYTQSGSVVPEKSDQGLLSSSITEDKPPTEAPGSLLGHYIESAESHSSSSDTVSTLADAAPEKTSRYLPQSWDNENAPANPPPPPLVPTETREANGSHPVPMLEVLDAIQSASSTNPAPPPNGWNEPIVSVNPPPPPLVSSPNPNLASAPIHNPPIQPGEKIAPPGPSPPRVTGYSSSRSNDVPIEGPPPFSPAILAKLGYPVHRFFSRKNTTPAPPPLPVEPYESDNDPYLSSIVFEQFSPEPITRRYSNPALREIKRKSRAHPLQSSNRRRSNSLPPLEDANFTLSKFVQHTRYTKRKGPVAPPESG